MNTESELFIPEHPLKVPVLFLIFNRLDTTKEVFSAIKKAKPPKLYVAADGARKDRAGEAEKVEYVRDYILSNIDWPCEVKTLFREENLGCKYAVSSAITWFFENEEMGIILEDDCLPSQSFFWFCEELLEKYKTDKRVWMISGDNFQDGKVRGEESYYFSRFNHIWGWATWSDRWKHYSVELTGFDDTKFIDNIFKEKKTLAYWKNIFTMMKNKKINTWDYQWCFTIWKEDGVSVIPNKNLITNIGFSEEATHTNVSESPMANMLRFDLKTIKHLNNVEINEDADKYFEKKLINTENIVIRIIKKVKQYFG